MKIAGIPYKSIMITNPDGSVLLAVLTDNKLIVQEGLTVAYEEDKKEPIGMSLGGGINETN